MQHFILRLWFLGFVLIFSSLYFFYIQLIYYYVLTGHVIPDNHLLPIALATGPSGREMDFTYQYRDRPQTVSYILFLDNSSDDNYKVWWSEIFVRKIWLSSMSLFQIQYKTISKVKKTKLFKVWIVFIIHPNIWNVIDSVRREELAQKKYWSIKGDNPQKGENMK